MTDQDPDNAAGLNAAGKTETPEEQAELEAEGTHIPLEDVVLGND